MRTLVTTLLVLLTPALAGAATPSEGVPLTVRRGFFTETDVGGFFTLGGKLGYSNLQTYLQLGLGYQFTINDGKGLLPIGFHVGIGANAQNCYAEWIQRDQSDPRNGVCVEAPRSTVPVQMNFSLMFPTLSVGYLHQVVERFYVGGKAMGGLVLLEPSPFAPRADGSAINLGGQFGIAASVEYATNMDHLSIGLDVGYRLVVGGPMVINALMFYPRVQYTF